MSDCTLAFPLTNVSRANHLTGSLIPSPSDEEIDEYNRFESPKSATFATRSSVSKIFLAAKSPWYIFRFPRNSNPLAIYDIKNIVEVSVFFLNLKHGGYVFTDIMSYLSYLIRPQE